MRVFRISVNTLLNVKTKIKFLYCAIYTIFKIFHYRNRKMTRSVTLLALIVVSVIAGPPFPLPGGVPEDSLTPQCRTPKCPAAKANSNTPITLPYPLDCLQYIICEESGPRIAVCPGDLVFNKVRQISSNYLKFIEKLIQIFLIFKNQTFLLYLKVRINYCNYFILHEHNEISRYFRCKFFKLKFEKLQFNQRSFDWAIHTSSVCITYWEKCTLISWFSHSFEIVSRVLHVIWSPAASIALLRFGDERRRRFHSSSSASRNAMSH